MLNNFFPNSCKVFPGDASKAAQWSSKLILHLMAPTSHMGTSLCPGCSISDAASACDLEKHWKMSQPFEPLHTSVRPRKQLLAPNLRSAKFWLCCPLGSKPVDRDLSVSPLCKIFLSNKKHKRKDLDTPVSLTSNINNYTGVMQSETDWGAQNKPETTNNALPVNHALFTLAHLVTIPHFWFTLHSPIKYRTPVLSIPSCYIETSSPTQPKYFQILILPTKAFCVDWNHYTKISSIVQYPFHLHH